MFLSKKFNIIFCLATFLVEMAGPCHAFSFFAKVSSSSASSAAMNEAVALYQKTYPAKKEQKRNFNASWGMPNRDIDGTKLKVAQGNTMGKAFSDRSEKQLQATFAEMSKIYGTESALKMVKDVPLVLAANPKNFRPSLAAFTESVAEGDEAACKEMIQRNPGLLFVKPNDAAEANDLTMQFSYIVAATRPAGPVLLYGTLLLLLEPLLELITGVPFKANILEQIF